MKFSDELITHYVGDALLGLIETRMPLVMDDAGVARAVDSIRKLVPETVRQAKKRGTNFIHEIDVNLALSELKWPFPFKD